jgi:hypothetical protein
LATRSAIVVVLALAAVVIKEPFRWVPVPHNGFRQG